MKYLLSAFILLCSLSVLSQSKEFKIIGTVQTVSEKLPLESATIYLERVKDSSLVSYTISDKDGKFSLEGKTVDQSLNLFVSYVGYQVYSKTFKIDNEKINIQSIELSEDDNVLDAVIVRYRAPITVKKDTLEFSARYFKTKKDANVEDLLKQLPGVEVDEGGKITVNGKDVNKILVNGKPFFGNDPTITTQNLTKDLIQKVQITDTKTKAEAFTGEEGNKKYKTINLTIKEENSKGVFGRVLAGVGTEDRYEFSGMLNLFDNDQRISVLAGGNNVNSPGFSFGEIQKMFGGARRFSTLNRDGSFSIDGRSFGGGQGITTSKNIGANYADDIGDKVGISVDYFFSGSNSDNQSSTQRENILPEAHFFSDSEAKTYNESDNHSANLEFEIELDSTLKIDIVPSLRKSRSKNTYFNIEETRNIVGDLINDSEVVSYVETIGSNFNNEVDITKKIGSVGSFFRLGFDTDFDVINTNDWVSSEANVFKTSPKSIIINQFTDSEQTQTRFSTNAIYRLPLVGKEFFLDFKINYLFDNLVNKRSTFNFDSVTQDYTNFNTEFSTDFKNTNMRTTPGIKLILQKDKWSLSLESGYVYRIIENKDVLRPLLSLKRNFENIELGSNFSYDFSPKSSIYINYSLSNQAPNVLQLSPFQDVSNPLNIRIGNPDLKPSNIHNVYAGFKFFNFQKGSAFNSYFGGDLINNAVVSRLTIDENFVRNTTYTNVNGNYNVYANASFSKTIKIDSARTLKYRVGLGTNFDKSVKFINNIKYTSKNTFISPNAEITFNWKEVLELRPTYRISFNNTNFDNFNNQKFVSHSLGIKMAAFSSKKFEWSNDINFIYNSNISPEFSKNIWLWNSTLSYSILKNQATLTLKAFDLLNQNNNARRTRTQDYIQDSQSTVLNQYFMLSFSWKFNSIGKNKINNK